MAQTKLNIVLCGFMGCGKSTVGKKLSQMTQMEFVDMDGYIEKRAGMKIPDIFEKHGEGFFRDLEHEAAEKRIAEDVKNSAYTIIEKKHATYYGVAMAVKRICTAVMRDEQTVLPVSSLMVGEYGLSDLAISMPTVVGRDGVVCRVPVPLDDDEQHELTASAKALKDIIDSVDFSC